MSAALSAFGTGVKRAALKAKRLCYLDKSDAARDAKGARSAPAPARRNGVRCVFCGADRDASQVQIAHVSPIP